MKDFLKKMDGTWLCRMLCIAGFMVSGCSTTTEQLYLKDLSAFFKAGTILSSHSGVSTSFEAMIADLSRVRIIYIGEQHTSPIHHKIQLKIIKALYQDEADISVGMEMFDTTYQQVLNEWSTGKLDEEIFLKRVHWYANWRYNFELYRDILHFIKEKNIRLVGLNIPFHIPPKIAIGGIETLTESDKKHLPEMIDTTNTAHRSYIENIFKKHHSIKGRDHFETFYAAQCTWEDGMAEAIARHLKEAKMVVLAGNGHIYRKFGIPDRVHKRTGTSFRTIYLAPIGSDATLSDGDYIWATPVLKKHHR